MGLVVSLSQFTSLMRASFANAPCKLCCLPDELCASPSLQAFRLGRAPSQTRNKLSNGGAEGVILSDSHGRVHRTVGDSLARGGEHEKSADEKSQGVIKRRQLRGALTFIFFSPPFVFSPPVAVPVENECTHFGVGRQLDNNTEQLRSGSETSRSLSPHRRDSNRRYSSRRAFTIKLTGVPPHAGGHHTDRGRHSAGHQAGHHSADPDDPHAGRRDGHRSAGHRDGHRT